MNEEKNHLEEIIEKALAELYEKDYYLIKTDVQEQAIVSRFALYFEKYIKELKGDYNLDLEYNRNLKNPKRRVDTKKRIRPDLIVHKRGNHQNNLLVLEFKTYWYKEITEDINKVKELINKEPYKYHYGAVIFIDKKEHRIFWC